MSDLDELLKMPASTKIVIGLIAMLIPALIFTFMPSLNINWDSLPLGLRTVSGLLALFFVAFLIFLLGIGFIVFIAGLFEAGISGIARLLSRRKG